MTPGQITIRQFTADDTMTWRTIRLEALANAPIAFGQTLENPLWEARFGSNSAAEPHARRRRNLLR